MGGLRMALCTIRLDEHSLRLAADSPFVCANRSSVNGNAKVVRCHTPLHYAVFLSSNSAPASRVRLAFESRIHTRRARHRLARAAHFLPHFSRH
jgi:hypothetical protein